LKHERIHIRRRDYLIKPVAFLALILHWFNPLMWACYYLMAKDMEMSCDESVMRQAKEDIRASYSHSLLTLSVRQNGLLSPLAFGESNVKARIKNVLNYKKPATWIIVLAVTVVVVAAVGLLAYPREQAEDSAAEKFLSYKTEYIGDAPKVGSDNNTMEPISEIIERNLSVILSSPKESSNPQDYINAHQDEYETILKYGDEALNYLLLQFENGNNNNLRGHIMMRLFKDILGARNNVTDDSLSPQDWFSQLSVYEETQLPNFSYDGNDPVEKLVYDTEIDKNIYPHQGGFVVVAPKIHGSYEEVNKLKVFVTTYYANYHLYDKVISMGSAGVVPAAITYVKKPDGTYSLEEYRQAMDGSLFAKSIKEFCTMPVSGKEIKGLADKILDHYGNYEDIKTLQRENIIKHLKENNQTGIKLKSPTGEIIPLT